MSAGALPGGPTLPPKSTALLRLIMRSVFWVLPHFPCYHYAYSSRTSLNCLQKVADCKLEYAVPVANDLSGGFPKEINILRSGKWNDSTGSAGEPFFAWRRGAQTLRWAHRTWAAPPSKKRIGLNRASEPAMGIVSRSPSIGTTASWFDGLLQVRDPMTWGGARMRYTTSQ